MSNNYRLSSEQCREVVRLYVDGLSAEEIVERLGLVSLSASEALVEGAAELRERIEEARQREQLDAAHVDVMEGAERALMELERVMRA